MKTIYKYELQIADEQQIRVPIRTEFLSVGVQDNKIFVWAKVETERSPVNRTILIRGTGNPLEGNEGRFIGTIHLDNFVWHIFEERP